MLNKNHRVQKVLAASLAVAFTTTSTASDLVQFATFPNTDFAMFGTGGMRNQGNATGLNPTGSGQIVVSGISGTVTRAFLYFQGPTNSASPTANSPVTFNGTSVTPVNIGFSSDNCWGFTNSQAYRADVSGLVAGNGTYTLANFVKGATADINGVSLVVFYNDGNAANNRDYAIFEGNDSNQPNTFDALGWNASLPGITYTSGTVTMRVIIADGQSFGDNGLSITVDAGAPTTIVPAGNNWQGATLPNSLPASAADTSGGLWDHSAYDITSLLTAGTHTVTLKDTGSSSDCLSMIAAVFDLPAGAAPPGPPPPGPPAPPGPPLQVPTLSTWGTITLAALTGLLALIGLRRREN